MKRLLIVLLLTGCGAALPAILAGVTTAAQLIELVDHTLSPQNQAAQQNCANQISDLTTADANLTETVAACDELLDAWNAVQSAISRLKVARGMKDKEVESRAFDEGQQRVAEWYDSYARYEAAVK